MRITLGCLIAAMLLLWTPSVAAHGALEINEFDTYAISDFEGHEDSFAWEGWEIWDVYAGDGYISALDSHGVYFKVNFAGDGTLRPTGGSTWEATISFAVNGTAYSRQVVHDGTDATADFEQWEWQIADGNVFQIHAWVPIPEWEGHAIEDLVVASSVDGQPRDSAPGGIYDPATGSEVPVEAPSTVVFPPIGEGRLVESVPLSGPSKFLDVQMEAATDNAYTFTVTNPLAAQGQHFMVHTEGDDWVFTGVPAAQSLDGGTATEFTIQFDAASEGSVAPGRIDFVTDIGGLRSFQVAMSDAGPLLLIDEAQAESYTPEVVETPGFPLVLALVGLAFAARRK